MAEPTTSDIMTALLDFREFVGEEFGRVHTHLKAHDERFGQIDHRFAQIDGRFAHIDERFGLVEGHVNRIERRVVAQDNWLQSIDANVKQLLVKSKRPR